METPRAVMLAVLVVAGCSNAPGGSDGGQNQRSDAGPDGGAARFIDLRFRGVGETLSASNGFGGGTSPGAPGFTMTGPGAAFNEGFFLSDFFFFFSVTYPDAGVYETIVQATGISCDTLLTEALTTGATVLGLGGDPTSSEGSCTAVSARPVDAGLNTGYVSGLSLGSSSIDFLNRQDFTRQYVVTALSEVDAGIYSFVAQAYLQRGEQFENRFVVGGSEHLSSMADDLSDAGMVITASTGGPSGYALVGTRPADGGIRRVALVVRAVGVDPTGAFYPVLEAGFAPVAFLLRQFPDGGFETVTIGQK